MKHLNQKLVYALALVFFISSCKKEKKTDATNTVEATKKVADTPEAQLAGIMDMWPGVYNNDKQIAKIEKEGKKVWRFNGEGEGGYIELQSHYIKLNNPAIGDNVLYVEEYRSHQPDSNYRQRILLTMILTELNKRIKI